jgi:hypothetical protein
MEPLFGKGRGFQQFPSGEPAMDYGGIGTPNQAALPRTFLYHFPVMRSPQFRWRDAMVIKYDSRFSPSQQWQNAEERIGLAVIGKDEVGRGEKRPAVALGLMGV